MSQENVEIVRRLFEVFNRGGPDAVIEAGFLSPRIVFDASRAGIPGVGVLRGREEVRAFFKEDWFGAFPFEAWEIQIDQPIDDGDRVIVKSRQQGRGASSGAPTALELGNIFTFSNGQVVRLTVFGRPEEAFEAAGLSE
jgi:ketosteroid isomerase-like protein